MPRPLLLRSKGKPYHVTSRTLFGEVFPLPLAEVWTIMCRELYRSYQKDHLAIHGFVLMNNHFHLLCHTPQENLDEIMQNFLRRTALYLQPEKKPLWKGRYKWSLIENKQHYYQVYRYLYQNPLRAGIVAKVEDYSFSTLREVPFPIYSHLSMSFGGSTGEHLWLNQKLSDEDKNLIRLGLRKFQFDVNRRKLASFQKMDLPNQED